VGDGIQYYLNRLAEYPRIKTLFATLCVFFNFLFGVIGQPIYILLTFIAFDLITGIIKSIKKNINLNGDSKFSAIVKACHIIQSKAMRKGIYKIIVYMTAIILANLTSVMYAQESIRVFVISWIGFIELKSIIENLEEIGFKVCGLNIVLEKIKKEVKKWSGREL